MPINAFKKYYTSSLFLKIGYILIFLFISCEEDTAVNNSPEQESLENTLNSNLSGEVGHIDDYFYNLSSDQINAKYYRYDNNAIENPQFYFEPSSDTLNFSTFPCYLTTLEGDLDDALTTRNLEDGNVVQVEQDVRLKTESYTYAKNIEWDSFSSYYRIVSGAGEAEEVVFSFDSDYGQDGCDDLFEDGEGGCLNNPDNANYLVTNGNCVWDEGEDFIDCNLEEDACEGDSGWNVAWGNDTYDSGEAFTDVNGNCVWDSGEDFVDNMLNGFYDEGEDFIDCNDDGTICEGDNGWEDNDEINGIYDCTNNDECILGENNFYDCSAVDGCESWTDSAENGVYDSGDLFIDVTNPVYVEDSISDSMNCDDPETEDVEDDQACGDAVEANSDPNSDNYNSTTNISGTQGDGLYDGNSAYDAGEEFVDENNNEEWDEGEFYFDSMGDNDYTDIYNTLDYKVNYDSQTMGDVEGMYYIDTDEWIPSDSTYYASEPMTFSHTFTYKKDSVNTNLMYRVNQDCNENNIQDLVPESYVPSAEDCDENNEIFIYKPESLYDYGDDGCLDIFEDGEGDCSDEPNYGVEYESYIDINDNNLYDAGEEFTDSNGNGVWDAAEPFIDNGNGVYDEGEEYTDLGNDLYDEGEEFVDSNGNGVWDDGESFEDTIGDCVYNAAEEFTDSNNNGSWDDGEEFIDSNNNGAWDDGEPFEDTIGNGIWDDGEEFTDLNNNGAWDDGEGYIDSDGNGAYNYPETIEDTGSDNCYNEFEDGQGGCLSLNDAPVYNEASNPDPNGDDFPLGTEGNGTLDALAQPCDDSFEDGQGGCFLAVNPAYISGDPNGDNDNNSDNYDADSNPDGTEGNGEYDEGELWIDKEGGTEGYDYGFCDRTNNIWDPKEAHLDTEDGGLDGEWQEIEPYQDRNCNRDLNLGPESAEKRSDIDEDLTEAYCEDTVDGIGGIWVVTPDFSFCDVGNGIWDKAEECFNGDETCDSDQLYIESDTPNNLIVSYVNEDGEYDLASPTVLSDVFLEDDVIDRWNNTHEDLIKTFDIQDTQIEYVYPIDSIVTVYTNPIIEQLDSGAPTDYYIAKSVWYDNDERDYDYHMFRKGDDGYIYKLIHRSYFLPAGFYGPYSEGGFWFEDQATEEVFLYTSNQELRDGERVELSRIDTTEIAEYLVRESYSVDIEPNLVLPMRQLLGQIDENGSIVCLADGSVCSGCASDQECSQDTTFTDLFKVSKEKITTMFGTGIEYVENSVTYFAEDYGIVKDDAEFRWNTPPGDEPEFEGSYRWEMIANREVESDCPEETLLQALMNRKEVVSIDRFKEVSSFNNDPYEKSRTYGLQRVLKENNYRQNIDKHNKLQRGIK